MSAPTRLTPYTLVGITDKREWFATAAEAEQAAKRIIAAGRNNGEERAFAIVQTVATVQPAVSLDIDFFDNKPQRIIKKV